MLKSLDFIIHLLISLFAFLSSHFDIWSDGTMGYSYINGATYQYYFSNKSDPELLNMNCTHSLDNSSGYSEFGYHYKCFKQDPEFGYGTIGIMFLPGFLLAFFLAHGFKKKGNTTTAYAIILISPLC